MVQHQTKVYLPKTIVFQAICISKHKMTNDKFSNGGEPGTHKCGPPNLTQTQTKVYLMKATAFYAPITRTDLTQRWFFVRFVRFSAFFLLNVLFCLHFNILDN